MAKIKHSNKVEKLKLPSSMILNSRLPVLTAPRGSRFSAGTCTESDNIIVSSDVNHASNIEENNNDD